MNSDVRFRARLVALLLSSADAYLVLRSASEPLLARDEAAGTRPELGVAGGRNGWGGRISLTICAGSGSAKGAWDGVDVAEGDTGVGRGRVAPPVRFIMKTGFGVTSRGRAPELPGAMPALPDVVAKGLGSGRWLAT